MSTDVLAGIYTFVATVFGIAFIVRVSGEFDDSPTKWKPYNLDCLYCGRHTLIARRTIPSNIFTTGFYCTHCEKTLDCLQIR